jgi:hypothetical protein
MSTIARRRMFPAVMIFSCGPGSKLARKIPKRFLRYDGPRSNGIRNFRLSAPVYTEINGELSKVKGPVRFFARGEPFWGGNIAQDYLSNIIVNPTYRSVLRAAERSQKKTRDFHHCFFEWCRFMRYEESKKYGRVMVLQLIFGS